MGRKNQRRDEYVPLDLSPDQLPKVAIRFTEREREIQRESRRLQEIRLAEQQRIARMYRGIDWTVCVVPGCGKDLMGYLGRPLHSAERRDLEERLPMCHEHAVIAWRQVQASSNEPAVIETAAMLRARTAIKEQAQSDEAKQKRRASIAGHIYFVRLNGLIKVGWSRDYRDRLRAYGPDVEVIIIYPGTRDDETTLHRQFKPVLAVGREWYEDTTPRRCAVNTTGATRSSTTAGQGQRKSSGPDAAASKGVIALAYARVTHYWPDGGHVELEVGTYEDYPDAADDCARRALAMYTAAVPDHEQAEVPDA